MKKISKSDMERIAKLREAIEGKKAKIEEALEKFQESIAPILEEAEEERQELFGVLDDIVNAMENYFDERSDKWQEGDAGSAYSEWQNQIDTARGAFESEMSFEIDSEAAFEPWGEMLSALDEENFPEAPEEV